MGIDGQIWDTIGELLVWGAAKADEAGGKGQVELASGETRNDVEHLALPGHYSVILDSDRLLILRRDDGGVSVAARTDRPVDAVPGERGMTDGTAIVRVLPTHILEVKGTAALAGISLGACDLSEGVPIYVARMGDIVAVGGVTIGTIVVSPATTTKLVSV